MKGKINKEKVIEKYIKGYKATEIAEILNLKQDTVIKSIYRYKKTLNKDKVEDIDSIHKKNRFELKEIIKAEKRLATQYMTTANLIKFNRQSFSTTKSGGLKFNEDRGAIPSDLPKSYYKKL